VSYCITNYNGCVLHVADRVVFAGDEGYESHVSIPQLEVKLFSLDVKVLKCLVMKGFQVH
jgi:hypothetical protein